MFALVRPQRERGRGFTRLRRENGLQGFIVLLSFGQYLFDIYSEYNHSLLNSHRRHYRLSILIRSDHIHWNTRYIPIKPSLFPRNKE